MSVNLSPQEYKDTAITYFKELLNYAKGTPFEEMIRRRIEMLEFFNIKNYGNEKRH